ncbi:MAG: amino acid adenylation domain-containing protein [Parasporobacterium sp.]|nr:amino acid adenylation domain-containing protein [Parasporobacterium sp.]
MELVTDYLESTAKSFPDKKAFIDEHKSITFSELENCSKKIGTVLAGSGYFQKPVCIFMEKSVECIPSMLGILYSGNFYTVLDVHMPSVRIKKILETLRPSAFITTDASREQLAEVLAESGYGADDADVLLYEEVMNSEIDENLLLDIKSRIDETATMFVLFTSGSTGVPKGVIIKQKAFPPYIKWYRDFFKLDDSMITANQTPFYFIMSCPDIYLTILCGGTCHIVPKNTFSFPVMLLEYLKERHVNFIDWVPSILCLIANFRALPEVHLDDLKLVLFGGEVMPAKQMNMWKREYPDTKFYNLYGLTESTEMISYYEIDRELDPAESIPIGYPVPYMKVLILDDNNRLCEQGQTGSLCISGKAVAEGYYNMPEKTAEVFTPNPLYRDGDDPDTKYMYNTGDLVKADEKGCIIYMGRKDFQIKHMGNRIELGEIETAVSSLEGIDRACCLYDTKRSRIVLFYTGTEDDDTIVSGLKKLLPAYMIPNRMEHLDEMPANVNGKIDRVALKELI